MQYITEIKVLAGTPGTGLSLAVETGWIKIAEILVPAASLTVIDANIYNIDAEKESVNNTNWTTTMASIYRNGTISSMVTRIVDNIAAIFLNTTHRGSDGKDHNDVVLNNIHRASDGKNHSDVVLNNTHRSSNGSDHFYMNQDVKTTASPTFVNGTFTGYAIFDSKKITSANYLHLGPAANLENTIFDKLSPFIPSTGNNMLATGVIKFGTTIVTVSRIYRSSTNVIILYGYRTDTNVIGLVSVTNGGSTSNIEVSLSW